MTDSQFGRRPESGKFNRQFGPLRGPNPPPTPPPVPPPVRTTGHGGTGFIKIISYNAKQQLLLVQFKNGAFWLFSMVPTDIAEAFRATLSTDYYFGNYIFN